jgi:hypothetical protein
MSSSSGSEEQVGQDAELGVQSKQAQGVAVEEKF